MTFARATVIGFVAVAVLLILVGCVVPPAGETAPIAPPTASETPTPSQTATSTAQEIFLTPTTVNATAISNPNYPNIFPGNIKVVPLPWFEAENPLAGITVITPIAILPGDEYIVFSRVACEDEIQSCATELIAWSINWEKLYVLASIPQTGYVNRVIGDVILVSTFDNPGKLIVIDLGSMNITAWQIPSGFEFVGIYLDGNLLYFRSIDDTTKIILASLQKEAAYEIQSGWPANPPFNDQWMTLNYCLDIECSAIDRLLFDIVSGQVITVASTYDIHNHYWKILESLPVSIGASPPYSSDISPDGEWAVAWKGDAENGTIEAGVIPIQCYFDYPLQISACRERMTVLGSIQYFPYDCFLNFVSWIPDSSGYLFEVENPYQTCPVNGLYKITLEGVVTNFGIVPGSQPEYPAESLRGWLMNGEGLIWVSSSSGTWGIFYPNGDGISHTIGRFMGDPVGAFLVP